jgi:hypothetical protein
MTDQKPAGRSDLGRKASRLRSSSRGIFANRPGERWRVCAPRLRRDSYHVAPQAEEMTADREETQPWRCADPIPSAEQVSVLF